ncbi:MAG: MaoC/PaaZ C-terminal domain-containing protein [Clostridia bacterium]|nr:MaoC/PaaZ C-terminal domain-containing protein [Clostridia bacterium]
MYFDEFTIGQRFEIGPVSLTLEEIKRFAAQYDPLPIHLDNAFASNTPYGGIIASGFHTLCAIWSQWVGTGIVHNEVIGGLGIDYLNWTAPVRPNDQLSGIVEVVDLIPSSKGGRGILVVRVTAYNQNSQEVLNAQVKGLIKASPG